MNEPYHEWVKPHFLYHLCGEFARRKLLSHWGLDDSSFSYFDLWNTYRGRSGTFVFVGDLLETRDSFHDSYSRLVRDAMFGWDVSLYPLSPLLEVR